MKHAILLLDEVAIVRATLSRELSAAGFHVVCAATASEALAKLRSDTFDLLLIDLRASASDRNELLRGLRQAPSTAAMPVIALCCKGDKQEILEAARLGVRECMLKSSATPEDILKRVRKCLAPEEQTAARTGQVSASPAPVQPSPDAGPVLSREETLRRLRSADMPSLSSAAGDLMSYVASPRASVGDIAASLKKDPALAARVLRIANSAAFVSARAKIAVIDDAIRQIGTATVRNLVASLGVFDAVAGATAANDVMRSWQHCLAVATVMEKLSEPAEACVPGVAYLVGLCHDLPDLMLQRYFPEHHAAVHARPRQHGRPSAAAYAEVFGISYRDLITHLLARFELPAAITDPIREFHAQTSAEIRGGSVLARLLGLAHFCTNGIMLSMGLDQPVRPLGDDECRTLLNDKIPTIDLPDLRNTTILTCSLISGPGASIGPAVETTPQQLLYVRETQSSIDPLHALLTLVAPQVTMWTPGQPPPDFVPDGVIAVAPGAQTVAALSRLMSVWRPMPPILWLGNAANRVPTDLSQAVCPGELPVSAESVLQFLAAQRGSVEPRLAA